MQIIKELAKDIGDYFNIEITESNKRRLEFFCNKHFSRYRELKQAEQPEIVEFTGQPIEEIAEYYCQKFGVEMNELRSNRRFRRFVNCRHLFAQAAHEAGHPYTTIGKFLGRRDHSTIWHYMNTRKKCLLED